MTKNLSFLYKYFAFVQVFKIIYAKLHYNAKINCFIHKQINKFSLFIEQLFLHRNKILHKLSEILKVYFYIKIFI